MRILQFTDTHLYGHADGTLRGVETDSSLRAVMAAAFLLSVRRYPRSEAALVAQGVAVGESR